jgi:DNA gyrase subunit A
VAAITLHKGAQVVSALYLDDDQLSNDALSFFVLTIEGMGKKVPLGQFVQKGRATAGVPAIDLTASDYVLTTLLVDEGDHLLVVSKGDGNAEQAHPLKASDVKMFLRPGRGASIVGGRAIAVVKLI